MKIFSFFAPPEIGDIVRAAVDAVHSESFQRARQSRKGLDPAALALSQAVEKWEQKYETTAD